MSLLDQASLVVVPSGYKEDVVYSVKPTDGSGDLTFTRASDGTRVNSQGLVENVPWNLLEQSTGFGSVPPWSKYEYGGGSLTLTSGQTDPNGGTDAWKFDCVIGTGGSLYTQNVTVNEFGQYNLSVWLKGSVGGEKVRIDLRNTSSSGVDGQILTLTNEWNRYDFAVTNNSGTSRGFQFRFTTSVTTSDQTFYAYGAQLNEGSTAKPYFPTTDRQNVPRLTYEGGCPSLLLEPQRTNLVTYSEQLDNAAWSTTNTSVTANATTSPDGTANADLLTDGTANSDHYININVTTASSTTYIQSAWFKKKDSGIYASLRTNGVGPNVFVVFDFDTGSVVGVGSQVSDYGVDSYANGWYRVWMEYTLAPTGYIIGVSNSSSSSIPTYTGTNKGFYIWGAQLEAGSYPTSYIPTTSASVTRVADAAYKTGISSLIGQSEGTLFVEFEANDITTAWVAQTSDGTSNNRTQITLSNELRWQVNGSGSTGMNGAQSITVGTKYKAALAFESGDSVFYLNGSKITSNNEASTNVPSSQTQINLGNNYANSSPYAGTINQAVLFKTRLTNAELAALTTL